MISLYRIEHLGLNVVLQLLVGVPLEMVHGATRIALVYVAGVVAGRQVGPVSPGVNLPRASRRPHEVKQAPTSRGPSPSRLLTTRLGLQANLPTSLGILGTATQRGRHVMTKEGRAQHLEQAD